MLAELLCILGISGANKLLNTQINRLDNDEWGTYRDANGATRLTKNGKRVIEAYNSIGERIIKYVNSGKVAVNIDEIEGERRRQKAIEENKSMYLFRVERQQTTPKYRYGNCDIKGNRYCQTNDNNSYYVIRTIQCDYCHNENELFGYHYYGDYYMDMWYNICFPTEETIQKDFEKYGYKSASIHKFIIDESNKLIKKGIDNPLFSGLLPKESSIICLGNSNNYRYNHIRIVNSSNNK